MLTILVVGLNFGAASPANWPMYRNNPLRTGVTTDVIIPPLDLKWRQTFAGAVISSPAIFGSRLYVGSTDNNLYAIDAATGNIIWAFTEALPVPVGPWLSSPTVATVGGQTVIFAGNDNFNLYAIRDDGATWTKLWDTTLLVPAPAGPVRSSPVVTTIGTDQVVIFGVWGLPGQVYALMAATGALYPGWVAGGGDPFTDAAAAGPFVSSPAILGSTLFIGSDAAPGAEGMLYAINLGNGVKFWDTFTLGIFPAIGVGNDVRSSPAIANVAGQNLVFFGADNDRLYALVAASGAVVWSQPVGADIRSSPAVASIPNPPVACVPPPGPTLAVIFGSDDGNTYSMRAADGVPCWTFPSTGLLPFRSSPTVSGQTVYIGSLDQNLYAIDINTGSWLWSFPATAPIGDIAGLVAPNPAISGSTLYFGSNAPDNRLYAFEPVPPVTTTETETVTETETETVTETQTETTTLSTATITTTESQTVTICPSGGPIPGFPVESMLIGLVGGLVALTLIRRRRRASPLRD